MHEERVERHCVGIDEAIQAMQRQFVTMQADLNEQANQNRSHVAYLEVAFNMCTATGVYLFLISHWLITRCLRRM